MPTISARNSIAFSMGSVSVSLLSQSFATYIVFYYVDVLGVRPSLISLAMVIHGIFSAFLNPLIGHMSDLTRSRWGRRIPYMLFGIAPLAAAFTLIWFPFVSGSALFWYFLSMVLIYDILFIVVVLNYSALFPEMFVTMEERTSVSSWRQMFGIIGMIAGVAIPPLLYSQLGWGTMGLIFGGMGFLFFVVMLRGSKEREYKDTETIGFVQAIRFTFTNKSFLTYVVGSFFVQFTFALLPAGIPFFTKYALHAAESVNTILLGAIFVTAIPLVYLWGKWARRFGPRKTMLAAVIAYALALSPFFIVTSIASAVIAAVAIGLSLAGLMVLLEVMLSEVIDEDERRTGLRREGMYFGMNGFIVKWGVSLQAVIMGVILESSGYTANAATQPDSAVFGVRLMLSGIPIVALLLAFFCFYLYPLRSADRSTTK
ncbi:MFS transporter [Paenibacillus sp. SI8]|uniref:MFS transporter n=1 Tax=unclassified Paenibacillus TaxID=185978 RepID=UPI00346521A0